MLVAGGVAWWSSQDDEPPVRGQVEAVPGVTAVKTEQLSGPDYAVEFDADIGTAELGDALARAMSILDAADSDHAPWVVARVGEVSFPTDLTGSYARTAGFVTAITAINPVETVALPSAGGTFVTLEKGTDLLASTRTVIDGLADAGVTDLALFDPHFELREETREPDDEGPVFFVDEVVSVSGAQDRLAQLARAISLSGATLYRAALDSDSVTVSASVAHRSDVASARRAWLDTLSGEVWLTLRAPGVEISQHRP